MITKIEKNPAWDGIERRRFPRLSGEICVSYRLSSEKDWQDTDGKVKSRVESLNKLEAGEPVSHITVNCSPLGMCIRTAAPIRVGIILSLTMRFNDMKESLEGLARVVWCKPLLYNSPMTLCHTSIPDSHLIGVEFIATNNGIASFIMQNIARGLIKSHEEAGR